MCIKLFIFEIVQAFVCRRLIYRIEAHLSLYNCCVYDKMIITHGSCLQFDAIRVPNYLEQISA